MRKQQKIAVIIWATDPEGVPRFLLRHNRPFDGYEDEWTIVFGDIERGESKEIAAMREVQEEYGITHYLAVKDLDYSVEYIGKHGPSAAHLFAIQAPSIDLRIVLNEESIGYDWVTLAKAKELMQHPDEFKALEMI